MRLSTAFVASLFAATAALPFRAEDAALSGEAGAAPAPAPSPKTFTTIPPSGHANAQVMNGRTVTASLRYAF